MRSVVLGVALCHLLAAAVLLTAAAGSDHHVVPLLLGCGLAWLWGLLHGLAADHVAAIDDVTRLRAGGGAMSTGTHFAVGHALAVCGGVLALSGVWTGVAAAELPARLVVAGVLAALCLWNVRLLVAGGPVGAGASRSLLLWLLLRTRGSSSPSLGTRTGVGWPQVVALGLLFGLVSVAEVLVMALAVGPREGGTLALLAVAVSFSAGMVLTDSVDSVLLGRMYAWSQADPARRGALARTATLLTALVSGLVATTITAAALRDVGLVRTGPLLQLARLGDHYVLVGLVVVCGFLLLWATSAAWPSGGRGARPSPARAAGPR